MKTYINGLYPKSKCRIYHGTELIFEGFSDEKGFLEAKLPAHLRNRSLRLTSNFPGKIESSGEEIQGNALGLFHTSNPILDVSYINDQGKYAIPENLLNPSASAKRMAELYRAARHKNVVFKTSYWIFFVGAPFLGFFLASVPGVVVGFTLSVVCHVMGPYADGTDKAI